MNHEFTLVNPSWRRVRAKRNPIDRSTTRPGDSWRQDGAWPRGARSCRSRLPEGPGTRARVVRSTGRSSAGQPNHCSCKEQNHEERS